MALLPTSQRDQAKVLIVLVALSLAGAYWYFLYDPASVELAKVALHVDSVEAANAKAKAVIAKGNTDAIREQARASRANLDVMRTLVPAANEIAELIDQVAGAARRAGLSVGTLEPEPVIEGEMFDTYRYRLRLNGSYHEIARMLTNIGSLNRIVTSLNLQLNPKAGVVSPPGKQILFATFEIQTFVVRTAPRARPPVKKPEAAAPPADAAAKASKAPDGGG